jgi:hypothetical protein
MHARELQRRGLHTEANIIAVAEVVDLEALVHGRICDDDDLRTILQSV